MTLKVEKGPSTWLSGRDASIGLKETSGRHSWETESQNNMAQNKHWIVEWSGWEKFRGFLRLAQMSCVAALFSPDAASFPTKSTILSFLLENNNDSHKCQVNLQLLLISTSWRSQLRAKNHHGLRCTLGRPLRMIIDTNVNVRLFCTSRH